MPPPHPFLVAPYNEAHAPFSRTLFGWERTLVHLSEWTYIRLVREVLQKQSTREECCWNRIDVRKIREVQLITSSTKSKYKILVVLWNVMYLVLSASSSLNVNSYSWNVVSCLRKGDSISCANQNCFISTTNEKRLDLRPHMSCCLYYDPTVSLRSTVL